MNVEASTGGRRITLDPIMEREPVELPVRRVESTIPCGFQIQWLDGTADDADNPVESVSLTSGAGMGSPWLALTIKMRDGSTIQECANMSDVVQEWVRAAVAAGPSPAPLT